MERNTSSEDVEKSKEGKTKIFTDLLKKHYDLQQSLKTMLQSGPEYDKIKAELKRIDKRLEYFTSPETYNAVRLEKEANKQQKMQMMEEPLPKQKIYQDLLDKKKVLKKTLDEQMAPVVIPEYANTLKEITRLDKRKEFFNSPEKYNQYRLKEAEKDQEQEYEIAKAKNQDAIQKYKDLKASQKAKQDLKRTQATDLNSIFSSPEPIYNPADSMSYLNPQESKIPPRTPFSNTPFINAEPSLSNPIYNNPLMPRQTTTFNTTAIKPRQINDELVPTSYKDYLNYFGELTKLPTEQKYDELANMEVKTAEGDVEDVNKARQELETLHGRTDEFFDGNDLFPKQDFEPDPKSGFTKMSEAQNEYDLYSGRALVKSIDDVLSSMGLGEQIDGLNLSSLGDNSLFSRTNTNQSGRDPYVNTNTNNLAGDLVSSLNFNNLLLGENSIYNRTRDLDLLSVPSEDNNEQNEMKDPTNSGTSLNFKSLNKRQMNKNFKKNKWQGTGERPSLRPTLADVRASNVDFKIPSMTYKGSQVNLVRRANRTTDMLNSEFEP
jgi:hypothetical protein